MAEAAEAGTPTAFTTPQKARGLIGVDLRQGIVTRSPFGDLVILRPASILPVLERWRCEHDDVQPSLEHMWADAVDSLAAERVNIPSRLTDCFRIDIVGDGRVSEFASRLKDAVERGVTWQGRSYAPLCQWSTAACKHAWRHAERDEQARWRVMIMSMHQVYCALQADELTGSVMSDSSWTQVRRVARDHAARMGGVKRKYHELCVDKVPLS